MEEKFTIDVLQFPTTAVIADAIREHNNRLHIFHDLRTLNERHFFGNACKVCVSTENTKLCARCKMVTYCSKEHQTLDWPIHKQICDLLAKVYNNIDRLLQFYKTRTLMHGRALVDRNLLKYLPAKIKDHIINESQALTEAFTESGKLPMLEGRYYSLLIMFPPICELCCGERINPNFWCKKCFTVGYCSLKHLQQNALHHSKFCSALELFRKYNQQILKIEKTLRQRFDVTARDIDLSKFESLTKFPENYDTFMKVIFGKNFKNCDALMNYQTDLNNHFKKAFPNENLDKKLVYYQIGDYFSPIGTFLHYMERIGFINNGVKKEKSAELNIFFLGIGWFDCSFLEVIDRVLIAYMKTPTSITPNLFFIGPCFKNWCYNRDPHVSFYSKITWVPFKLVDSIEALPHPDLIVMFDFKKERRTETFAADDLKQILNCPDVLKHNVPLLITSALRERIDDASKTARSEKAKVLVDPEENPYASKIPILLSGGGPNDSPLMYANSFAMVVLVSNSAHKN